MTNDELRKRTKEFAISLYFKSRELPNNYETNHLKNQLLRSGSSIAANYRAACKSKSEKDFINKIRIMEEEADECCFWMEIIVTLYPDFTANYEGLIKECKEFIRIFGATYSTMQKKLSQK
ncbi:MAG: four helix bundle protein [Crocinitomicaceae bacterium]